jgi:hypothetical protein
VATKRPVQRVLTRTHFQVHNLALPSLLRRTACHHITVDPRETSRTAPSTTKDNHADVLQVTRLIRHNRNIEENFRRRRFLARQVGNTWNRPCRPSIELEPDRLLIATGPSLTVHGLAKDDSYGQPVDGRKGVVTIETVPIPLIRGRQVDSAQGGFGRFAQRTAVASPLDDLTGVVSLGSDQYILSTVGGKLQKVQLRSQQVHGSHQKRLQAVSTALYPHTANVPIESLTSSRNSDDPQNKQKFLTASHNGLISLYNAAAPWSAPATFSIGSRPWSSHLSLGGSQPYVVVGSSGLQPLNVYPLVEGGAFDPASRRRNVSVTPAKSLVGARVKSAVYDIVSPPPDMANPFSNNPSSILLSAWFDGRARIHDLRASGMGSLASGADTDDSASMRSRPVMEMFDPWLQSSLYSCAWTGPGNIATGSSRHGMVSLFDTRMLIESRHSLSATRAENTRQAFDQPLLEDSTSTNVDMLRWHRGGYSAYSPGRPESPVYSLKGEGGRLWGVTDRRAFAYTFDVEGDGPGLPQSRGWNIIGPGCEASPPLTTWARRNGGFSTRGETVDDVKDYAAGYAMDDRQLRLFESLR